MLTFVETDLNSLVEKSKTIVEKILGRTLKDSDPLFLFLKSLLSIIIQQREIINDSANQNLLAFARGENLECIAELVGIERQPAQKAFCTAEVTLSAARNKTTTIPAGTRFNAGDNIHFALAEDVIFLSGETVKTARAECLEVGKQGNNYKINELNKTVDYAPFLKSITNISVSEGGADIEDDDALRERIRQAPESFSVAGSKGAYEFWTKNFNTEIIDAYVTSPEPGCVDVYFLMTDGVPGAEMIQAVQNYLSADELRPLTDFVTVKAPEIVEYNIDVQFWISRENMTRANSIVENVESAVEDFILWQRSKLGRDINPTELYFRLRQAGVKRAVILQPEFLATAPNSVALCQNINVEYKGLEDA